MKSSANPLHPAGFWPEQGVWGTGFRCVLKNYGTGPAFGVTLSLEAVKREIVRGKDPTGWHSGNVLSNHNPIVMVPQPLVQQGQEPFTFYVCSYDPDHLIEITLPTSAFINTDDPSQKATVPLRITSTLGNPLPIMPTRRQDSKWPRHSHQFHERANTMRQSFLILAILSISAWSQPAQQHAQTPIVVQVQMPPTNPWMHLLELVVPGIIGAGLALFGVWLTNKHNDATNEANRQHQLDVESIKDEVAAQAKSRDNRWEFRKEVYTNLIRLAVEFLRIYATLLTYTPKLSSDNEATRPVLNALTPA